MTREEKAELLLNEIRQNNDGKTLDFIVPGYAAKRIITYQGIRQDLILCRNAIIKLLTEDHDNTLTSSLFHTVVILYGKCFTDATSSKSPKLEVKVFKNGHEHLLPFHEIIMNMRHNFVAHRGSTEHDFAFAYIRFGIKNMTQEVRVKQLKKKSFDSNNLPHYIELIEFLINLVEDKFYKAGVKVWNHLLSEYSVQEFSLLKIAGP